MVLIAQPRSDAMVELVRLAQTETELRARVEQVSAAARLAAAELTEAREALVQLERSAGADGPTAQQRAAAEKRLARAEEAVKAPWPERAAGAEHAARDAHQAVRLHAAEYLDELVHELEQDGHAAAEQVDHTAEAFLAATRRRAEAEHALISLVALTRRMSPGDVNRSRADEAARTVQALIDGGGETAPVLRARQPVPA
jgi:hypothetical protein